MRRRVKEADAGSGLPLRLRRYDPADWPSPECHPECAFWAALAEWRETNPPSDDDGVDVVAHGPDTPWHDEWV